MNNSHDGMLRRSVVRNVAGREKSYLSENCSPKSRLSFHKRNLCFDGTLQDENVSVLSEGMPEQQHKSSKAREYLQQSGRPASFLLDESKLTELATPHFAVQDSSNLRQIITSSLITSPLFNSSVISKDSLFTSPSYLIQQTSQKRMSAKHYDSVLSSPPQHSMNSQGSPIKGGSSAFTHQDSLISQLGSFDLTGGYSQSARETLAGSESNRKQITASQNLSSRGVHFVSQKDRVHEFDNEQEKSAFFGIQIEKAIKALSQSSTKKTSLKIRQGSSNMKSSFAQNVFTATHQAIDEVQTSSGLLRLRPPKKGKKDSGAKFVQQLTEEEFERQQYLRKVSSSSTLERLSSLQKSIDSLRLKEQSFRSILFFFILLPLRIIKRVMLLQIFSYSVQSRDFIAQEYSFYCLSAFLISGTIFGLFGDQKMDFSLTPNEERKEMSTLQGITVITVSLLLVSNVFQSLTSWHVAVVNESEALKVMLNPTSLFPKSMTESESACSIRIKLYNLSEKKTLDQLETKKKLTLIICIWLLAVLKPILSVTAAALIMRKEYLDDKVNHFNYQTSCYSTLIIKLNLIVSEQLIEAGTFQVVEGSEVILLYELSASLFLVFLILQLKHFGLVSNIFAVDFIGRIPRNPKEFVYQQNMSFALFIVAAKIIEALLAASIAGITQLIAERKRHMVVPMADDNRLISIEGMSSETQQTNIFMNYTLRSMNHDVSPRNRDTYRVHAEEENPRKYTKLNTRSASVAEISWLAIFAMANCSLLSCHLVSFNCIPSLTAITLNLLLMALIKFQNGRVVWSILFLNEQSLKAFVRTLGYSITCVTVTFNLLGVFADSNSSQLSFSKNSVVKSILEKLFGDVNDYFIESIQRIFDIFLHPLVMISVVGYTLAVQRKRVKDGLKRVRQAVLVTRSENNT